VGTKTGLLGIRSGVYALALGSQCKLTNKTVLSNAYSAMSLTVTEDVVGLTSNRDCGEMRMVAFQHMKR